MQNAMLMLVGVACLGISGLVLFKLAPRDGEPAVPWLERESAAMGVSIALIALGAFGIGLLVKALAG